MRRKCFSATILFIVHTAPGFKVNSCFFHAYQLNRLAMVQTDIMLITAGCISNGKIQDFLDCCGLRVLFSSMGLLSETGQSINKTQSCVDFYPLI